MEQTAQCLLNAVKLQFVMINQIVQYVSEKSEVGMQNRITSEDKLDGITQQLIGIVTKDEETLLHHKKRPSQQHSDLG